MNIFSTSSNRMSVERDREQLIGLMSNYISDEDSDVDPLDDTRTFLSKEAKKKKKKKNHHDDIDWKSPNGSSPNQYTPNFDSLKRENRMGDSTSSIGGMFSSLIYGNERQVGSTTSSNNEVQLNPIKIENIENFDDGEEINNTNNINTTASNNPSFLSKFSNLLFRRSENAAPVTPPVQDAEMEIGQEPSFFNRIKRAVGIEREPEREKSTLEKLSERLTCSKQTRAIGFLVCFVTGILCILASLFLLSYALIPFIAIIFALLYTIGISFIVLSTFFVAGPMTQFRQIIVPKRIIPSVMFLFSLILTLIAAIKWQSVILSFFFILVQMFSLAYYIFTYIPFSGHLVTLVWSSIWAAIR